MEIPHAFKRLASLFDYEVRNSLSPETDLIEFAVSLLTNDEMRAVEKFLVTIMESNPSPKDANNLWLRSGGRVAFSDYNAIFQEIIVRITAVLDD